MMQEHNDRGFDNNNIARNILFIYRSKFLFSTVITYRVMRAVFGAVLILIPFLSSVQLISKRNFDVILEKIESLNGSKSDEYSIEELRITKFNRSTYTLNVKFEIFVDLDESFNVRICHFFRAILRYFTDFS